MMDEMAVWEYIQIYHVLALYQAPIDSDVNLHLPENWFDMLKLDLKMKVSNKKVDPCLFV